MKTIKILIDVDDWVNKENFKAQVTFKYRSKDWLAVRCYDDVDYKEVTSDEEQNENKEM